LPSRNQNVNTINADEVLAKDIVRYGGVCAFIGVFSCSRVMIEKRRRIFIKQRRGVSNDNGSFAAGPV